MQGAIFERLDCPPPWGFSHCPPIVGLFSLPPHRGAFLTAPPLWGGYGGAPLQAAEPPSQSPPRMGGEVGRESPRMGGEVGLPPIVGLFSLPPHCGAFLTAPPLWGFSHCPPIVGGLRGGSVAGGGTPLSISPQDGGRGRKGIPQDGGRGRTAPHRGAFLTAPPPWGFSHCPPIVGLFSLPPHRGGATGGLRCRQRNPPLNLPPGWGERSEGNPPGWGERSDCPPIVGLFSLPPHRGGATGGVCAHPRGPRMINCPNTHTPTTRRGRL